METYINIYTTFLNTFVVDFKIKTEIHSTITSQNNLPQKPPISIMVTNNVGLSDHQMTFCTGKTKKEKVGVHKHISFRSFKKYLVDEYEKALGQLIFPKYEKYSNVDKAFDDFFHKLLEVVNKIAHLKTVRIKNTSSECFDKEIAEKLSLTDKLFKKFKSSHLNIDWQIYRDEK